MKKRTKIVCTIGPASEKKEILEDMVKAGMNVARLNFSHGTYENHAELIKNIREIEEETGEPVAIMQDLQGPKIRVGLLPETGVVIKQGESVVFDTSKSEYAESVIPIDYSDLHKFVKPQERILLADGKIEVKIDKVEGTKITTTVVVGGILISHKGINVPDTELEVRALTEKDKQDARFGVEYGVDLVALSFVRNAEDIIDLRYSIKEYEKELGLKPEQPIRLVAKIERNEAVENIREILDVVDGIMVARGDLGIEIPAEDVPLVQKKLIDEALDAARPVIVATQMLDSMQENPRPTRAEVSDVANAVIDHADAVMLSNETATGKYPVVTVKTMTDIIVKTEKSEYDDMLMREPSGEKHKIDDVISGMSRVLAEEVKATLILAASISGETGRLISRNKPELPIFVATNEDRVRRQLNLSWGVVPFILPQCSSIEELVERSVSYMKKQSQVKSGDKIIVVAGEPVGRAGHVNLLEVREVD
ncbi:MAG: pyruvate kinase [Candidatus Magasanikbacteria bacterium]|nr:pyruvate kinase [Candidatus Magasanikbacteria bacterium]